MIFHIFTCIFQINVTVATNNTSLDKPTESILHINKEEGYFWCFLFNRRCTQYVYDYCLHQGPTRAQAQYISAYQPISSWRGCGRTCHTNCCFPSREHLWTLERRDDSRLVYFHIWSWHAVFWVFPGIFGLHFSWETVRYKEPDEASVYDRIGIQDLDVLRVVCVFHLYNCRVLFLFYDVIGLQIWYVVASCVFVSLLILTFSYCAILVTVRCSEQPQHSHRSQARKERKLTMTLFIVTLVSLSVWIPYVLFTFLESYLSRQFSPETLLRARGVCEALFFANSFVNPILYTIRIPQFRRASINLVTCAVKTGTAQTSSLSLDSVGVDKKEEGASWWRTRVLVLWDLRRTKQNKKRQIGSGVAENVL